MTYQYDADTKIGTITSPRIFSYVCKGVYAPLNANHVASVSGIEIHTDRLGPRQRKALERILKTGRITQSGVPSVIAHHIFDAGGYEYWDALTPRLHSVERAMQLANDANLIPYLTTATAMYMADDQASRDYGYRYLNMFQRISKGQFTLGYGKSVGYTVIYESELSSGLRKLTDQIARFDSHHPFTHALAMLQRDHGDFIPAPNLALPEKIIIKP